VSAERLAPLGAGADVDLRAAQQADEIEALKRHKRPQTKLSEK